ncbi:hypothetical protein [Sporanaerobacter acetigenes]|uniref:Uncharacterized protein n=1 Tax=Sporanaerobacter acetigenes DSM 13106 TaxID=1123281 RepID=A0A1M5RYA7_9FIRM|nr:hypothetical protein [Sporanaerobacter acetigenes]SHH31226.1 hypothetical protein SAMN02745180_00016 [Sporanaerobacter acetigenes DSM 13106]
MNNLERLKMEIEGFNIEDEKLIVYLMENDLTDITEYNPKSNTNKKAIYQTALNVLESIANNPQSMKNYKTDDISITHFATNIQNRIDDLRKKIANMVTDEMVSENDATFVWVFK